MLHQVASFLLIERKANEKLKLRKQINKCDFTRHLITMMRHKDHLISMIFNFVCMENIRYETSYLNMYLFCVQDSYTLHFNK